MPGLPIVIGLTGGIGTGKSNVRETLQSLGAEGIDADRVAHEVIAPGMPAYAGVIARFGAAILAPQGEIDRQRLGALVFASVAALRELEAIIHPAVEVAIQARVAASQAPLVVIEAIKLLEAGLAAALCREVWVTHCSVRQQIARLAGSRGLSAAEVRRRMALQMSPAEMIARADRVIDTRGTIAETRVQLPPAWRALGMEFPPPRITPAGADEAEGLAAVLNCVAREGELSVIDRTFTPAQERAFLRRLPDRSFVIVAHTGSVLGGFQVLEPYASYTRAMDHVGTLGSYVLASLRGRGLGRAMLAVTLAHAREAGFKKLTIAVRSDNPLAIAFYVRHGFVPCGRLARQAFVAGRYVDELLFERFTD